MRRTTRLIAGLVALLGLLVCAPLGPALAQRLDPVAFEAGFQDWLQREIWPEARRNGVSRRTFDEAFAGVTLDLTLPELVLPGAGDEPAIDQPEFRTPAPYFNESNLATLARLGRDRLGLWAETLAAIEQRYGVPGPIVLAIWGRETAYGRVALPHDAIRALATAAFTGRRAAEFRIELIAALQILDRGDITRAQMVSSWAGALGQPQLQPTGYLEYAVDFDGDGRRDIWNSVPDTLATIANFFSRSGWRAADPWGTEVVLPRGDYCVLEGPTQGQTAAAWQAMGFAPVSGGQGIGAANAERFLLAPGGALGPAFLVSQNFYVIKEYNFSDLYALFVGHLADRIAGNDRTFVTGWQPIDRIDHGQIRRMQLSLEARGYDVGGADGLVGFRTRISIGRFQISAGLPVTCFPNAATIAAIG